MRLVSVFRYLYLTLKRELVLVSYFKNHWSPFSVKYHYSLVIRDQYWSLFIVKSRYVEMSTLLFSKSGYEGGGGQKFPKSGYVACVWPLKYIFFHIIFVLFLVKKLLKYLFSSHSETFQVWQLCSSFDLVYDEMSDLGFGLFKIIEFDFFLGFGPDLLHSYNVSI